MNRHFNVLAAGKNHAENMAKYYDGAVTAEYVAYEYAKAEEYRNAYLSGLREAAKTDPSIMDEISIIENESLDDFYLDLTQDYDLDRETGNAISSKNPNGKFYSYNIAKNFANPFILKDGTESFSARFKDIDWNRMCGDKKPYETAWDLVIGKKKPRGDYEKNIYENMKNRTAYFMAFGDRDRYVTSSTAFWCYAFLSENGEWSEIGRNEDQYEWVKNFYNKFVKKVGENTLLTLYECARDA